MIRLRSLTVALLGVLLAALTAGCGSDGDSSGPPHGSFFGVAPDGEMNETDYARMATGGVGVVRVAFAWNAVENDNGNPYDWSGYDRVFLQIAEHGMKPLATVFGTPVKYEEDPRTAPTEDPETLSAWRRFLAAAAQRYGTGGQFWDYVDREFPDVEPSPVQIWEIWNEPNSSTFWQPKPDVEDYGELLEDSAAAIVEVDSAATIMSAGMFATPQSDGAIVSYDFLEDLLARDGIDEVIDVVGLHPYAPDTESVIEQVDRTHEVVGESDVDADLWATEIGWGSNPDVKSDLAKGVDEQAQLLSETMSRLYDSRDSWDLSGVVWYTWHDPPASLGACGWCRSAGLLEADRDAKPSWEAYAELAGGSP